MQKLVLATLAATMMTGTAHAAKIEQNLSNASISVGYGGPVGQTFTAIDPNITSLAFGFVQYSQATSDPLTVELRAGSGTNGALLAHKDYTITSLGQGSPLYNLNFSADGLNIGSVYSLILSTTSKENYIGVDHGPNAYAGGDAILFGEVATYADLKFRVIGGNAAVPEPASWLMMTVGFGALGVAMRRRRSLLASPKRRTT